MNTRNTALDQIKAIACLLIVCHHLAFYGPMSDVLRPVLPNLLYWFDEYARMAVQVFLVLGGYFAACTLAPQGTGKHTQFWTSASKRFVRLALPYSAALMVAILVNETVRGIGFQHPSVSATPTWESVVAHLLLLHSLTGFESLSAGLWYVAIDFQLYALCLLWFWLCHTHTRWSTLGQLGIAVATAASLWVWNLRADWDVWALYFMGAYGLGMMAWWATHSANRYARAGWLLLIAALSISALLLEWRDRIAVSAITTLILAVGGNLRWPSKLQRMDIAPLTWLGQRSYSIFLIHFPMSLLVNAEVHAKWPDSVIANALGMLMAMGLSIAAGAVLYECTERPQATWERLRRWQVGVLSTGLIATATQLI